MDFPDVYERWCDIRTSGEEICDHEVVTPLKSHWCFRAGYPVYIALSEMVRRCHRCRSDESDLLRPEVKDSFSERPDSWVPQSHEVKSELRSLGSC
jgi:hypothetical protein